MPLYSSASEMWRSIERTMAPMVMMRKNLGEEKWAPLSAAAHDAIVGAIGDDQPRSVLKPW